jgi:site-specific DNA recombinase
MSRNPERTSKTVLRCAIYTRKSTDEGLDQEFNSLDAQREAAEAYIASQKSAGWVCVPDRYDDGGFTGANMERPAVTRLMADVEAGKIDAVAVYKVDRLSRSLLDFARMMESFQRHRVSFVSVTQHFNTATSMGRLILNVLLSFAQFEREMISERTRDKMAAARRKGKWLGGVPVLGYDVDRAARRLVVNQEEAARVRDIFALYLRLGGLVAVVEELARRGWVNKRWITRKGVVRVGKPFHKGSLHYLLTNVTYRGRVRYKDEIHDGDHEAIVSEEMFGRVQAMLQRNRRAKRRQKVNGFRGVLEGLLYCAACQSRMIHTYTSQGTRRYRYYVCASAQQRGWDSCPSKSLPALQIEQFVLKEVLGTDQSGAAEWESRTTAEQAQAVAQWVDRVEYDGSRGDLCLRLKRQDTR